MNIVVLGVSCFAAAIAVWALIEAAYTRSVIRRYDRAVQRDSARPSRSEWTEE